MKGISLIALIDPELLVVKRLINEGRLQEALIKLQMLALLDPKSIYHQQISEIYALKQDRENCLLNRFYSNYLDLTSDEGGIQSQYNQLQETVKELAQLYENTSCTKLVVNKVFQVQVPADWVPAAIEGSPNIQVFLNNNAEPVKDLLQVAFYASALPDQLTYLQKLEQSNIQTQSSGKNQQMIQGTFIQAGIELFILELRLLVESTQTTYVVTLITPSEKANMFIGLFNKIVRSISYMTYATQKPLPDATNPQVQN